jgi:peptide chain release factor 2
LKLEEEISKQYFWQDHETASQVMQKLEDLKSEVQKVDFLKFKTEEILELLEIIDENDEQEIIEITSQINDLQKEIDNLEFLTFFSGKYDSSDAIVSIYSGAGGDDAQDWAEMLLKMYLRWAEKNDFKVNIIDKTMGGEAGIKSATIEILGRWAYGKLRSEAGVHRLVRLSPFNSDNLRQTSFARVEILPVVENSLEVEIKAEDLRIDTYRSSGAGGQSVNTTDSAVRITHIPTGLVAQCQNERSQFQNKEKALKILQAKLYQRYLEEQEREKLNLRGEIQKAEWGSQIRSYVLHPYKLVKDHRTKFETANVDKILDGDLDNFIEAYLKWNA